MPNLAVLDIGTNSIHMVLAEVQPDYTYKILDRFKDMTRLGDGVFTSRRLSDQAMLRPLVDHCLYAVQESWNPLNLVYKDRTNARRGRRQFAFQVKVPVKTLYPWTTAVPTQSGLGEITTTFAWNVASHGQVKHFLSLGLQWESAAQPVLGAPWALQPAYAVAMGLARWLSLTAQLVWLRSVGSTGGYPETDILLFEPILVLNLPGRSFLSLDAKLGWNLVNGSFVPLMKGAAGIFTDRQKSVSISAWYQGSLTSTA